MILSSPSSLNIINYQVFNLSERTWDSGSVFPSRILSVWTLRLCSTLASPYRSRSNLGRRNLIFPLCALFFFEHQQYPCARRQERDHDGIMPYLSSGDSTFIMSRITPATNAVMFTHFTPRRQSLLAHMQRR